MSAGRQIHAAIFDMDGLLIDSEPLWDQAELEVIKSLGVDINRRDELPDTLGLRIDLVVDLWFAQQPWKARIALKSPHGLSAARLSWLKPPALCYPAYEKPWPCVRHKG